jgi:hypothetical protein
MGQRSAKELESEIKGDEVAFVANFFCLPAFFLVAFVLRIREHMFPIGFLFLVPLLLLVVRPAL